MLTRRSHLKILAPVIDAARLRSHEVVIVGEPRAAKKGDALNLREVQRMWPSTRVEASPPHSLDVLIGPEAVLPYRPGMPMVGVDSFYDCWLHPPRRREGFTMCYTSEYHRDTHHALWVMAPDPAHEAVVGWLLADHREAALLTFLQDWPISSDRDTAVFFALKMDVPEPWRYSRQGRAFYKAVASAARAKAHAEGLTFVVKSRAKHHDPWWLRWGADEYWLDDVMAPPTSLSLLARAKWCVHFESGAGLEAALMGCYSIAVAVPQPHIIDLPGGRLQYGVVAMHAWPGVACYGLELPTGPRLSTAVDPEARAKYLAAYVGNCDGQAGRRVVEVAECSAAS